MVVRRKVSAELATVVWNSVRRITHSRQLANLNRLARALQKEHPKFTNAQAERIINECIEDGVLIPAPKGYGPQSYDTPTNDTLPKPDNHDWYCIECHLPGNVEYCASCFRVFHKSCQDKKKDSDLLIKIMSPKNIANLSDQIQSDSRLDENGDVKMTTGLEDINPETKEICDDDICSVCKLIAEDVFIIDSEELNFLSNFIFSRIKDWLPINICDGISSSTEPWNVPADKELRCRYFWYQPVDLTTMQRKATDRQYNCLNEIRADLLTLRHNVSIYHGLKSDEVDAANYMLDDACHDIDEIKQCISCYHHSNERSHKYWFCLPCHVPHELVWAKQTGFDYWPAKVIKRISNKVDVRFFGGKYLRAVIDEKNIKPIHVPKASLKIKTSPSSKAAYDELELHQLWLRTPKEDLETVIQMKTLGNRTSKKSKKAEKKSVKPEKRKSNHKETPVKKPKLTRRSVPAKVSELENSRSTRSRSEPANDSELENPRSTRSRMSSRIPSYLTANDTTETLNLLSDTEDEVNKSSTSQSQDHVISSTQDIRLASPTGTGSPENPIGSPENPPQLSDNKNIEAAEDLRRQMSILTNRDQLIQLACDAVQEQVDKFTEKIRIMSTSQTSIISDIKKKQWCYNCEQEAIYHCCWNTSYCSTECQQTHWHADHKRNCRRKRT